jgi:hypothetical protein
MATRIYRSKNHAIFITIDDLQGLRNFLAQHYETFEWEAACADGSHLTNTELQSFLDFENPNSRKIKSLTVSFRRENFEERGTVVFENGGSHTCSCNIHGVDDADTLHIANELTRMFREYRPWYSFLRWMPPGIIMAVVCIGVGVYSSWHTLITTGKLNKAPEASFVEAIYVFLPFMLAFMVVVVLLHFAWDWLFPNVWFAIGRQLTAFTRKQAVRRWIFGSMLLAILLGILVNWISAKFLSGPR